MCSSRHSYVSPMSPLFSGKCIHCHFHYFIKAHHHMSFFFSVLITKPAHHFLACLLKFALITALFSRDTFVHLPTVFFLVTHILPWGHNHWQHSTSHLNLPASDSSACVTLSLLSELPFQTSLSWSLLLSSFYHLHHNKTVQTSSQSISLAPFLSSHSSKQDIHLSYFLPTLKIFLSKSLHSKLLF